MIRKKKKKKSEHDHHAIIIIKGANNIYLYVETASKSKKTQGDTDNTLKKKREDLQGKSNFCN